MAPKNFWEMKEAVLFHLRLNDKAYSQFNMSTMGQKSIREMFAAVWDLEETHLFMTPVFIESKKCEDEADRMRIKGNKYYKKKNFEKTIELYNRSIMTAPHPVLTKDTSSYCMPVEEDDCFAFPLIDPARYGGVAKGESKALAKVFANRSAIMYALNLYDKCIHDIEMALEYGFPVEFQEKLHERKTKCLEAQRTSNSSNDSNPEVQGLSHLTLQESNIEEFNPQQSSGTPTLRDRLSLTPQKLPVLLDQNKSIPSISSALNLSVTSDKGRGLFAVRDIHPGEVLCVERAYRVNIEEDQLSVRCSFCLRFSLNPVPCPGCTKVMFCCESCRLQSLAKEHWIECKILPTLISLGILEASFSYKLWKSINISQLKEMLCQLHEENQDNPELGGFNNKGVYNSTSYQTIRHLHADEKQIPSVTLLDCCWIVFVIVKVLEQSGRFFLNDSGEAVTPSREDVLLTGTLLLSHWMKIAQNSYDFGDKQNSNIGKGVFPASSLINHSCNPSVGFFTFGRRMILRALRPISAGEEATISYGPVFGDQDLKQRRISLEQYCFVCCCEACEGNWPSFDHLEDVKFKSVARRDNTGLDQESSSSCKQAIMGSSRIACDDGQIPLPEFDDMQNQVKEVKENFSVMAQIENKLETNALISKSEFSSFCGTVEFAYNHYIMPCRYLIVMNSNMKKCLKAGL